MMNNNLSELYGEDYTVASEQPEQFYWYETADGDRFGIRKSRLSHDEQVLLDALFPSKGIKENIDDTLQQKWASLLFNENMELPPLKEKKLRYIHFHLKEAPSDFSEFQEAMIGLFSTDVVFLFKNEKEGVMIQESIEDEHLIEELEQMAAALTADFFLEMSLFVGQVIHNTDPSNLLSTYQTEVKWFASGINLMPSQLVFTQTAIVPAILFSEASQETIHYLQTLIEPVSDDAELLKSIRAYLESNLNITLASKQLYVHRNSLQYRVDKFIERTGIDVKSFKGAVMVYLALYTLELR
ncbi:PucR family transcriptional regulator [Guptibacillus algicola]|uniref:PucR family transcriptional regulator n=1 Tax=Guptibacillus algicola TaxID=225844 RepID=UPI001CD45222|nr:helix-turn-helix domain-containing protein [Alkalihalobacillus algicola]MCA0989217.1 helix-turn-helix domain-containing protein [Alkalihalobacillus algicola]